MILSKYTITIYELQKNNFDFGLQDYAIFNENYREILNNAILDFYKFREIGFINPNIFKHKLNARMDLIMRNKYNALYEAKAIEFNPLYNIDITETFEHNIDNEITENGTQKNTSSETDTTKSKMYNTTYPNERITDNDIESPLYANMGTLNDNTIKSQNNSEIENNNKGNNKTSENYTRKTKGSSAGLPFSKALIQLKQYLDKYELDKQVIEELGDLFMSIL